MDFFTGFKTILQHILEYVEQKMVLKDVEKDAKSMFF